jgi:hypothetical protein
MTEQEWLTETARPQWLIALPMYTGAFARTKKGKRKLLLFAVGCCRMMDGLLWDDRLRNAIEVAERYADGLATDEERSAAAVAAAPLSLGTYSGNTPDSRRATVGSLAYDVVGQKPAHAALGQTAMPIPLGGLALPDGRTGKALLCDVIREVFGNFINPAVAEKHWLRWNDRTIPRLAQAIYDEKDWDRMGVLADALVDAGCSDDSILTHLRGPGPHVRGCWAVDLLLGRS